jgi:hypothetical protein
MAGMNTWTLQVVIGEKGLMPETKKERKEVHRTGRRGSVDERKESRYEIYQSIPYFDNVSKSVIPFLTTIQNRRQEPRCRSRTYEIA